MELEEIYDLIDSMTLEEVLRTYPAAQDFLKNLRLSELNLQFPMRKALEAVDHAILEDFGMDAEDCIDQMAEFILATSVRREAPLTVESITIVGGHTKDGIPENLSLTISRGEVVSIVGPTGSGKSRLLADVECLAQGDTLTGRQVLVNGQKPDAFLRTTLSCGLVAQLSQNMNFVMDLTVEEFLRMHARSRQVPNENEAIARCHTCANELSGEKFDQGVKVTQLSGGQSRALMIADTACISASPIVLIDEIENAGIDRIKAVQLLMQEGKIILISTHDPLLALNAGRRLVMKSGGIHAVLETSETEKRTQAALMRVDSVLSQLRQALRSGDQIAEDVLEGLFHVDDV